MASKLDVDERGNLFVLANDRADYNQVFKLTDEGNLVATLTLQITNDVIALDVAAAPSGDTFFVLYEDGVVEYVIDPPVVRRTGAIGSWGPAVRLLATPAQGRVVVLFDHQLFEPPSTAGNSYAIDGRRADCSNGIWWSEPTQFVAQVEQDGQRGLFYLFNSSRVCGHRAEVTILRLQEAELPEGAPAFEFAMTDERGRDFEVAHFSTDDLPGNADAGTIAPSSGRLYFAVGDAVYGFRLSGERVYESGSLPCFDGSRIVDLASDGRGRVFALFDEGCVFVLDPERQ